MPRRASSASAKISFGSLAVAMIENSGRTIKEVADKLPHTPASQFTRWKKGLWTYIPEDKLMAIVRAISDDPREQCDLIMAYLHDLTPIPFRPMMLLQQKGEAPVSINDGQAAWSDPMRRRMDDIAEAYPLSDDFALMTDNMVGWAKRLKKQHGQTPKQV